MEFHLNYTPPRSLLDITHADKILLIGSCFSEYIGEKFKDSKFKTLVNPNGILFNPLSISNALRSYVRNSEIETNLFVKSNDLFYSLNHHGDFSHQKEAVLYGDLIQSQDIANNYLKEAKYLIITFGSAFVYRHIATNHIVANCHKLPQQDFKKELLKIEDVVAEYNLLIRELKQFNPGLNIIFTVSPVKYLRDGIIENNLSKSILIQSVHQLTGHCPLPTAAAYCSYFPAYELVNDDLRDYRFYKDDMAHPNQQAIDYVWEKFCDCYFNEETKQLLKKTKEINQALNHRPINENSSQHKEFKTSLLKKCTEMENSYPFLNFSEEKEQLINQ